MRTAFELFHRIADQGCARVRRYLTEQGLLDDVALRNVEFDSHRAKLNARGGDGRVPALWDGQALHVGAEAVLARLDAFRDIGRNG